MSSLLFNMVFEIFPLVKASTGYILINTTTSPNTPGQKVAAIAAIVGVLQIRRKIAG